MVTNNEFNKFNKENWNELVKSNKSFSNTSLPEYGPYMENEDKLQLFKKIKNKKVLEVGCASGKSLKYLKDKGAKEVWGLDISEEQIKKAKELNIENSYFYISSMENNPGIPVDYFDYVLSLYSIGYSSNPKKTIKLISKYLKKIDASLGKYAVSGEEDQEEFVTILNQSNFTILNNDYELVYKNSSTPILLVGLSSKLSKLQNIDEGFGYFNTEGYDSNIYTISLVHEPDSIDNWIGKYNSDIVFAGHSHNGNIRIPFIGSLSKVDGAKKYDQEYYKVKDADLFISSGMGTNGPGFRLFCRPSINFLRLSNK